MSLSTNETRTPPPHSWGRGGPGGPGGGGGVDVKQMAGPRALAYVQRRGREGFGGKRHVEGRWVRAGALEWVAMPPPGDLADAGIKPGSPPLAGRFFTEFSLQP